MLAVLVTAIWGANFSVIKLGLATIDPFVLAGARFTLAALPAVFFVKKPDVPWKYIGGYGLIFGVGLWGMVNLGIKAGLSAGIASLLLQLSALFTIVLGAVALKEKLNGYQGMGLIAGFAGLACVLFVADGSVAILGVGLVVVGAAAWSVANLIVKRSGVSQMLPFLVWSSLFSPIPLFALALLTGGTAVYVSSWQGLDAGAVASVLYQVYPVTLAGYWVWNGLLRTYPMSTVAPLSLLVPVFGILGSVVIFGETLPALKLTAIILIISGLSISTFGPRVLYKLVPR